MNIRKMQQLEKLGFQQDWLNDVKANFHPKKKGKYEIKIYDIKDIGDEPDEGIWIDTTCFDDDLGLSIVLHFFEGNGYVMRLTETGEEIGRGILDDSPFYEAQQYDDKEWEWRFEEVKELIAKQVAEENAKPREYIRKRKPTEDKTKMKTSAGEITTRFYDDGIAKGVQVMLNGEIVAMLDVYEPNEGETEGEARVLVYCNDDDEPTECITINR